jgi:HEAT repeat protein
LIALLKEKDTPHDPNTIPKAAGDALGAIGPDAGNAIPILLQFVKDGNKPTQDRSRYMLALRQVLTPANTEVLPDLLHILRSDREPVEIRVGMAMVLGSLREGAGHAATDIVELLRQEIKQDRDSANVYRLMDALGAIGAPAKGGVPFVLPLVGNKEVPTGHRARAAEVLGKVGDASDVVIKALEATASNDPQESVRRQARIALWRLRDRNK